MTFKLRDGVLITEIDNGVALLDEDSGQYYDLNPTGALVLRAMADDGSPEHAVRALVDLYEVEEEIARQDVADLISEFRSAGLVVQQAAPRRGWWRGSR